MNLSDNTFLVWVLACLFLIGVAIAILKPRVPALQAADQWIFGHGSPTSLGVFRILVGFFALINFLMISVDFDAWFSERGYVPWAITERWSGPLWRFNLIEGVTDTRIVAAFYALVCASAFLTMIGLYTRPASIILALGTISLHMRNPIILHGGDTVLRVLVLYVAVAPSGAACSVDRLIALWKGRAPQTPLVSLWPQRFIQFQVAVIYFTSVWHKRFGATWLDGTATWYPAQMTEFDRFWVPEFVDSRPFIMMTTYGTLLVEFALATLVFYRPFRKWVLLGGLLLHASIEYRFNIPLFGWLMCTQYVAFYDGHEVSAWAKRIGERLSRFRVTVRRPAGKTFDEDRGAAVHAMDALGLVTYEQGKEHGWTAERKDGSTAEPFWASLTRSLGAWPLLVAPWAWSRLLNASLTNAAEQAPKPNRQEGAHARA